MGGGGVLATRVGRGKSNIISVIQLSGALFVSHTTSKRLSRRSYPLNHPSDWYRGTEQNTQTKENDVC